MKRLRSYEVHRVFSLAVIPSQVLFKCARGSPQKNLAAGVKVGVGSQSLAQLEGGD